MDSDAMVVGIVFGVFVFLISFLGCCGALKQNRVFLGIYIVFEFIIFIAILTAGIVALVYGGDMDDSKMTIGRMTSNFVVQTYYSCCLSQGVRAYSLTYHPYGSANQQNLLATKTSDIRTNCCPAGQKMGVQPDGTSGCVAGDPDPPNDCSPPTCSKEYCDAGKEEWRSNQCMYPVCNDALPQDCCVKFDAAKMFAKATSNANTNGFCTLMFRYVFKGAQADVQQANSCADVEVYGAHVNKYVLSNIKFAGAGLCVIASILFLLFIASLALCFKKKDDFNAEA